MTLSEADDSPAAESCCNALVCFCPMHLRLVLASTRHSEFKGADGDSDDLPACRKQSGPWRNCFLHIEEASAPGDVIQTQFAFQAAVQSVNAWVRSNGVHSNKTLERPAASDTVWWNQGIATWSRWFTHRAELTQSKSTSQCAHQFCKNLLSLI